MPSGTYTAKLLKTAETFLSRWKGARAQLWDLQPSHTSLRVLLQAPDRTGNLLIVCLDPMRIRCAVRWDGSDLSITEVTLPQADSPVFRVTDERADAEIICGGIEIKENVKLG